MKRKTLPQARHFSEVENRLSVGGSAAKECPTPHFSWACAPGVGELYKVAGAASWSSSAGRLDAGRDARSLAGAEDLLPATAWGRQEARRTRGGRPSFCQPEVAVERPRGLGREGAAISPMTSAQRS